jgi:putative ABC transport system permease protein
MMSVEPPRLWAFLLRWILPRDTVGRSIWGDLDQEFRDRARTDPVAAGRWYRREARSVMGHRLLGAMRLGTGWIHGRDRRATRKGRKGDPMGQRIWRELRFTVRALARSPRFTVVAAITLALGIGAATAIFSAVNGVLLRPLPYPESGRIVGVWHGAPDLGYDQFGISPGIFHQYLTENQVYEAMGLYVLLERTVTEGSEAERVRATASTAGLFKVLDVQPLLGRTYTEEEATEGGPGVVVLSYALWQRRFGGREDILGRTIPLDGSPNEIIGVMPPGFDFGGPTERAEIWIPLHLDLENGDPGNFSYQGVARLKAGVPPEAAVAQEEALIQRARERWADQEDFINFLDAGGFHPTVHPLQEEMVGGMETPLWILLGTVGLVLLIACANVANLFLVRAEGRQRELAVRAALGATRRKLAGQFLLESLVLAGVGGVLGLGAAWGGTPLLLQMAPPELPRLDQISMDGTVLGFALGVSLLSALLFGAAPALRYNIAGLLSGLRYAGRGTTEGRERHLVRNALVVGQTALAMILLVGSGLLVKSFWEIRRVDPGFDTEGILTFRIALPPAGHPEPQMAAAFHQELLDRLRALPGVEAAGAISSLPLAQSPTGTAYDVEDLPTPEGELSPMFWYKYATPGYFQAMGISVMAGRAFERADHEQALGNIVVSQALVDRLWPGEDPLGRRLRITGDTTEAGWGRIVGVVENTLGHGLREDPLQMIYHAVVGPRGDQGYGTWNLTYALRSESPRQLIPAVRRTVREMDSDLPVAAVRTMKNVMADSIVRLTFTALSLGIAAVMALLLGAVGLYGVLSYVVSQRTQEMGVRLALGARAGQVQGLVVASGARLAVVGLVLGMAGAGALTRLLQGLLFGTEPLDPATFAGMSLVLLAVGLLASYVPARRAARVDPVESMRAQ